MKRLVIMVICMMLAWSQAMAGPAVQAATVESVQARTPGRQLDVTISGLEVGVRAKLTVTGPGRYYRVIQRTTGAITLKGLRPGVYRVAADPVTTGGRTVTATVTPAGARVTARRGGAITVTYPLVPAVSATPKSTWTWDSTLPDGTVVERQTGSITFGQQLMASGQSVMVTYTSTTTYPSAPTIGQDGCFDAGVPPLTGLSFALDGTTLSAATPLPGLGSLVLATPMTTKDCVVNGRQARTRSYTGPATFYGSPTGALVNAPVGLVGEYATRQNNDPLTATLRVTGDATQTSP